MTSLQQQVLLYCIKHSYPIPTQDIKECFKNVVRTNNSKKLQYCKH